MTACLCHAALKRAEQNSRLIGSMSLCSTRLTQPQGERDNSSFVLVDATGRDGRILDLVGVGENGLA